jgi:capsular exopolysaccharide synthesis family protein
MEEEFELKDFYNQVKKNKIIGLSIFLLIFISVIIYSLLTSPIYEAKSLVMVTNQDQTSYLLGSTISKIDLETQREIILSSSVLNTVYTKFSEEEFQLKVEPIKNSNVIEITVESTNQELVMKIANEIAKSYVFYTKESRKKEAIEVTTFISEQLKRYKKELDLLNTELLKFESKKGKYDFEIENLQEVLNQQTENKEKIKEDLDRLKDDIKIYKNQENLSFSDNKKFIDLENQIAIKDIEYNDALSKKNLYNTLLLEKKQEILNITLIDELEYQSVLQNVKAKENIFDYLLSKSEEIGIISQEKIGNVKIIEEASIPEYPIKPNLFPNIIIGFIVAIIGSIGLIFLKDVIMNRFVSIKEIESEFELILGTINIFKNKDKNKPYLIDSKNVDKFAENIRMLATNLMAYLYKNKEIKKISITSAIDGEGKSTIATNLSIALANSGSKVLLVDSNLRHPGLNHQFKIKEKEPGLTDIIINNARLDQVIKIRKTSHENLFLLTAGKSKIAAHDMLTNAKMKDILKKLNSSDFEIILFDNSSLQHSESYVMSSRCDGTILVISDKTNKEDVITAKKKLEKLNSEIIGVIVNQK